MDEEGRRRANDDKKKRWKMAGWAARAQGGDN
jgi:hypothetical protein